MDIEPSARPVTVLQLWHDYSPYWHMLVAVIASIGYACLWVHNVSGHEARIDQNEKDIQSLKISVQRIDDVASFLGVPKRNNFTKD